MTLKEKLIQDGRTRWLDVGCGGNFEDKFYYLDTFPEGIINPRFKERYFRVDIVNAPEELFAKLGKFDLVRMQHTFEHLSYEEGKKVLKNCAKLLNKNGYILITTPDLKIHIQKYLNDEYKNWDGFKWWANQRIPQDAPNSFYFSIFAHSMPYESHKWCYDFEGLKYQLELCGEFKDIQELKTDNSLSSVPFTHNRPEEDVCIIAVKK
jgi:predicted SAM-dependent methyltransferase